MHAGRAGRATVGRTFGSSVCAAVRTPVCASVGSSVRTAVRASVGAAVRTSVMDVGCAVSTAVHRTFLLLRVLLGVRHVSS
ncbi:hypothetical protein [Streptomyces sp. NPDC057677]|uniref:hypothetical protein n=1 Tax=unclassified Streptomyces TaxID=2593676 RepID=UPI003677B718